MINAIQKNKVGKSFISDSSYLRFNPTEDTLTSSIFSTIRYLPIETWWQIIRNASYQNSLPVHCHEVEKIEFWPLWKSNKKTRNYVEPDVFIQFTKFDLIIEAKKADEKQQYAEQWRSEIIAYRNEYREDKKLFLLAVGGNNSINSEMILDTEIVKLSWNLLLLQIVKLKKEICSLSITSSVQNSMVIVLEDIITYFEIHDYYAISWFEEDKLNNFILDYTEKDGLRWLYE